MTPTAPFPARASFGVLATAVVLTVVFHLTLAERPFGLAFALFVLATIIGLHVVAALAKSFHNHWAYIFLGPVLLSVMAQVIYANDVVRVLGFFITFFCLTFFAYWLVAPKQSWRHTISFWPAIMVLETIFPFPGLGQMFNGRSTGKRVGQILLGMFVALPFLLILGALFASADPLFRQSLEKFFEARTLAEWVFKIVRDAIVGIIFLAYGWMMFTRGLHGRFTQRGKRTWELFVQNRTALYTFLGLLNALFLLFIGFQLVYFFGGVETIQSHGLTYAAYAREGFFQLLVASGIVFAITWFLYAFAHIKHMVVRVLLSALLVETGLVIISAVRRLTLYVDAYGLTVARWWAMAVMLIIAIVLIALLVGLNLHLEYNLLAKMLFLFGILVFSLLLVFPTEHVIASWNVNRFLNKQSTSIDAAYLLNGLSSIAMRLYQNFPQIESPNMLGRMSTGSVVEDRKVLTNILTDKRERLEEGSKDWRNLVWSDYRALAALGGLK